MKAGHNICITLSKTRAPSRLPASSTNEARKAASSAITSPRARAARFRAVSLGVPSLSNRSAFSSSLAARSRFAAWASRYSRTARLARHSKDVSRTDVSAVRASRRARTRARRCLSVFFQRDGRRLSSKRRNVTRLIDATLRLVMARILVRPVLFVVITLSLLLPLAGCSDLGGGPRDQANDLLAEANEAIDDHNRLFENARNTYEEAKEAVEAGDDPSEEAERITQARETIEDAQANLQEARESLVQVQDLDVDPEIKDYANLLAEALDTQIAAEDREIDFYRILEEDPSLESNNERARNILQEVGDGYQRAEDTYERAQELADANPDLIKGS